MGVLTYLIDGWEGVWTHQGTSYRPAVSSRYSGVSAPGVHGAIPAGRTVLDEQTLNLRAMIQGTTEQMEVELTALRARLTRPGDITVARMPESEPPREEVAIARLLSMAEPEWYPSAVLQSITLMVPAGMWRDPVPQSSQAVLAGGVAVALPALAGGSGPITDAVARVRGPASRVEVLCAHSGSGLSWSGTLTDEQYVYLDAGTLTARRSASASAWTTGGAVVTGGLDYPAAGPLVLWPDPAVTVTATGGGPTTSAMVRARRAFL